MKKIVVISDTHGKESWLDLPKCDILIHCGDFHITSRSELDYANYWFKNQNADIKLFSAGNHDTFLEEIGKDKCKELLTHVRYLENETIEVEGLKMYFSHHTPFFNSWAFMYPRRSLDAKRIWEKIPYGLDFLITHGPAYQILDYSKFENKSVGCEVLQREIFKKQPSTHLYGHIHENGGQHINTSGIDFYNCSVLNGEYKLVNQPTVIEVKDATI